MTDTEHGFLSTIGASPPQAADGGATLTLAVDDRHLNAAGTVHGGLMATFALIEG